MKRCLKIVNAGSDEIGSTLKITVEKCVGEEIKQIPFELQRADMRSILKLKNVYIALAG